MSDFCGVFTVRGLINYTIDEAGNRTLFVVADTLDSMPQRLKGNGASIAFRTGDQAEHRVSISADNKAFALVRVADAAMDKIEMLMLKERLDGLMLSIFGELRQEGPAENHAVYDVSRMELRLDGPCEPA